ncbi:MAG TPA: hypothetical protein VNX46_06350, partial [Candidatus Acidoferrum sp.]|nr:hypothetical protein [Candidatus Acidoferrum sp.]
NFSQLKTLNYKPIMATLAQIAANRLNAQKSTGPRTAAVQLNAKKFHPVNHVNPVKKISH